MVSWGKDTVVRERATVTTDAHNSTVESWDTPDTLTLTNVRIQHSSSEDLDASLRQGVQEVIRILDSGQADVGYRDRIRITGGPFAGLWYVRGNPKRFRSPTGRLDHHTIFAVKTEG